MLSCAGAIENEFQPLRRVSVSRQSIVPWHVTNERWKSGLFVCDVAVVICKGPGRRPLNVRECFSVCKRDPVIECRIELEERAIVLDHHLQKLLHAFLVGHPVDFLAEVLKPCTLFPANLLTSPHHRLLYERHGSEVSVGAQWCMSETSINTERLKNMI